MTPSNHTPRALPQPCGTKQTQCAAGKFPVGRNTEAVSPEQAKKSVVTGKNAFRNRETGKCATTARDGRRHALPENPQCFARQRALENLTCRRSPHIPGSRSWRQEPPAP